MSPLEPNDPMRRLRAANPVAPDGAAPPPMAALLGDLPATTPSRTSHPRSGHGVRFVPLAGAVALVAAAVGAVALTGAGGPRTDVVEQARAALAPRGEIVHTVVRADGVTGMGIVFDGGKRVGRLTGVSEQWTAGDPLRMRTRTYVEQADGTRATMESAYAAGVTRSTGSWEDELRVAALRPSQRRAYERQMTTTSPTQLGPDPIQGLRTLLDDGGMHADGTVDFHGRKALRLVGRQPARHYAHGAQSLAVDVEYLVDPRTYAPLQLVTNAIPPVNSRAYGGRHPAHVAPIATRIRFETYERIPLTDETATLLRLDAANRRIVRLHVPRTGR